MVTRTDGRLFASQRGATIADVFHRARCQSRLFVARRGMLGSSRRRRIWGDVAAASASRGRAPGPPTPLMAPKAGPAEPSAVPPAIRPRVPALARPPFGHPTF
jgi:hypothetical protein